MIKVFGYNGCTYCTKATDLLKKNGKAFEYYDIKDPQHKDKLNYLKDRELFTVPQVLLDEVHIGGYSELLTLSEAGLL